MMLSTTSTIQEVSSKLHKTAESLKKSEEYVQSLENQISEGFDRFDSKNTDMQSRKT